MLIQYVGKKLGGVLLVLVVLLPPTLAQINESDTTKFQLNASFAGRYQTGNVNLLSMRSKLILSTYFADNFVFKSQNTLLYQELNDRKLDADYSTRNFLYFKPTHTFYPLALAFISGNFRRRIDQRTLLGVGETWNAKKGINYLKLSMSIFYEQTKYNGNQFNLSEYQGSADVQLWRWALYANGQFKLLDHRMTLNFSGFIEPAFENVENFRAEAELALVFKIIKGLSFRVEQLYFYEGLVVDGIDQSDSILLFGFNYAFASNSNK